MDKEFLHQIDQAADLYPLEKLDDQLLICECFCVSVADIRRCFQETQKVDLDTLRRLYGLGEGCQTCVKRLDWIDKIF